MNRKEVESVYSMCVCVCVCTPQGYIYKRTVPVILMTVFRRWIQIAGAGSRQKSSSDCQKLRQVAETNSVRNNN